MVYMDVKITTCNGIYDVGVKAGAPTGIPH
jgi:hypothetical protein